MIDTQMTMKRINDDVTRVSSQLYVKATMMAVMMRDVNSTKMPSFSEMPSWSTLAVLVMVPAAAPDGIESRTWMVWPKRHCR